MEKEHNAYIGDVVNGLAKEAAFYKAKCTELEKIIQAKDAEISRIKNSDIDYSELSRESQV